MPQIEIRPALATDLPLLLEIDHGYKTNYVWQLDRSGDEGQVEVRFREIRLPRSIRVEYPRAYRSLRDHWTEPAAVLVGLLDGHPVGYITLSEALSPASAWVTDWVVHQELRRQGIGTALILAGQEWARQRGDRRMIIEMQSKNTPAIHLAMKLGFEFSGYNDHYYINQDIALFFAQYVR